jgi:hypothetical protein
MDDAALQAFLSQQAEIEIAAGVTVVRRDDFVFANFGFGAG